MSAPSKISSWKAIAFCTLLTLSLSASPTLADDIVKFGSSIEIEEWRVLEGDAVSIGGSVDVLGEVEGDVVSVGGSVHVSGTVRGDVVSTGGSVILDSTAVVYGDVTAVGGILDRHPHAVVHGEVNEIDFGPFGRFPGPRIFLPGILRFPVQAMPSFFALRLIWIMVAIVLVLFVLLLAPRPTSRLADTVKGGLWRVVLVGLLADILVLPVLLILAISVIGIPLLPLAVIGIAVALLFGFAGISLATGRQLIDRLGRRAWHPIALAALGVVAIQFVPLMGALAGGFVALVGSVITFMAWTIGFGAVILTRFGTRLPQAVISAQQSPVPDMPGSVEDVPEPPLEPTPSVDEAVEGDSEVDETPKDSGQGAEPE